ncbi:MAG: GGDEF domain-containing protein [Solirubrobacteraceae bacterium]
MSLPRALDYRRLKALDVQEERDMAGRVAGILYLTAGGSFLALLLAPGVTIANRTTVISLGGLAIAWGLACLTVVDWQKASPLVSHASTACGLPATAIAMAATGGAASPARAGLLFVVLYASYFYPPREAIPYLAGCVLVLALPLAYDPDAVGSGAVAELIVLIPAYGAIGFTIMVAKGLLIGLRTDAVRLSLTDALTGLANRRAIVERLGEALASGRAADAVGLLVVDLDTFKEANTRFGHPGGDRVLCTAADTLVTCARASDLVGRLGGDEFAIVARNPTPDGMQALAARVVEHIRAADARLAMPGFRLSCSVGWALAPGNGDTVDDLLAAADLALHVAKIDGKDRAHGPLAAAA